MRRQFTIRLPEDLLAWLRETSRRTGIPLSQIIREHLERAKAGSGKQKFFRHVGAISGGPADLSSRKGYSKE
jgi:hypothetical protein